jgi:hypothetical protein
MSDTQNAQGAAAPRLSRRRLLAASAGGAVVLAGAAQAAAAPASVLPPIPYTWRSAPYGGGGFVDGFVYHPGEKGLLYARTDVGGAYRYDPAAKAWIPLLDCLGRDDGDLMGVLSMAIDPADPSRLYLACGEYLGSWARDGAVLRSADRGATWTITALTGIKLGGNADGRGTGERLQVDPNDGRVLFLGTNQDGLFKSVDGGASFAHAGFPSKSISLVLFEGRGGARGTPTPTLYVGCADDAGGLYKSTDGGASFAKVPGLPNLIPQRAVFDAAGDLYLTLSNGRAPWGGDKGGVFKLASQGGDWREISPMRPGEGGVNFAYCGLDVDNARPGTVVVATINRYSIKDDIYLSRDGGVHWTGLGAKARHHADAYPWMVAGQRGEEQMGNWIADARIDPFNSDTLIYGTGSGVWMTQNLGAADAGKTVDFDFAVANFEETVALSMKSPPAGAALYVAMGDVSGAGFDDVGQAPKAGLFLPSWESNQSVDYAELAPQYVVRTADNGATFGYFSSDGGLHWRPFPASPHKPKDDKGNWRSAGVIAISAGARSLLWAPEKQGGFYSHDAGRTWTASAGWPDPSAGYMPIAADRAVDGVFYVHDRVTNRILMSLDGGASFAPKITGLAALNGWENSQLVATPGRVTDLWLVMPKRLFHTPDDKSPASRVTSVDDPWMLALGKAADGATYPALYLWGVVRGVSGFWRSDNGGLSWARINDDAHQFGGLRSMAADPTEFGTVYLGPHGRGVMVGRPAKV